MSGSFYSLNSQYNSLLALITDGGVAGLQGLEGVLAVSEDAGNRSMTNVDTLTVDTINYTTLNPPVPALIGNIDQVLGVGNNANNKSITNLGSVQMKSGGGGTLTFQDGTIQSTAFTGVAATPTLSAVITAGSSAGNQNITGLNGILSPSTLPLNIAGLNGQDINLSALPQGINPSGAVNIQTSTGATTKNWAFNSVGSMDLPAAGSLEFGGGSKMEEVSGELELTSGGGKVIVNGDLELDAGGGGTLIFQDGTIQSTAFTGVATLSQVVAAGNDASGSITGVTSLTFADTTTQSTAYTGVPTISSVLTAGSDAGSKPLTGITNVGTTQITFGDSSIQTTAFTGVAATPTLSAVLTTGSSAGNQNITDVSSVTLSPVGGIQTIISGDGSVISGTGFGQTSSISSSIDTGSISPSIVLSSTGGGLTQTATISDNNFTITGTAGNQYTIYTNDFLNLDAVSGVDFAQNPITSVLTIQSLNTLTLQTNTALAEQDWSFDTALTFPDGTQQTTAYTGGGGGDQNLASVLGEGADGANIPMTSIGNMSATNWTLGGFGGGSPDSYLTNQQELGTLFLNTKNISGGVVQSLAIDSGTNGAVFGVNIDMGGRYIQGVNNIVSSTNEVIFTDDSENATGAGLTLLGTGIGSVSGNYAVAVGLGVSDSGDLGNGSVGIGHNAAYQGAGASCVAVGEFAGGISTSNAAMGAGAVAVGNSAGAGSSTSMATGAVAVGNSAGGFGMNSNAIAIGNGSGKGTVSAVPQGSNSICIGANSGNGFGAGGVPPNSFVVSSIRSVASAVNQLTYNTTTKEIQYAPTPSLATVNYSTTLISYIFPYPTIKFVNLAETLSIPSAGNYLITGNYQFSSVDVVNPFAPVVQTCGSAQIALNDVNGQVAVVYQSYVVTNSIAYYQLVTTLTISKVVNFGAGLTYPHPVSAQVAVTANIDMNGSGQMCATQV